MSMGSVEQEVGNAYTVQEAIDGDEAELYFSYMQSKSTGWKRRSGGKECVF